VATISLTDIVFNSDLESATVNSIFAEIEDFFNGTTASADLTITGTLTAGTITDSTASLTSGAWTGITNLTMSGTLDLGTNTIADGVLVGNWDFGSGTIDTTGALTAGSVGVDNITINGNDISTGSGNLTLTPVAGSSVVIDGAASFDAGVVTGITSLTATNITGTLQTAAQGNITSLGTLTSLNVDNISIDGSIITTTEVNGNVTINANGLGQVRFDTNTFIVDSSTNRVGINNTSPTTRLEIGGDLKVSLTSTFSADVVVGTDLTVDTNTLYVDATNDEVGINTLTPSAALHVDQPSATGATPVLNLDQGDTDQDFIDFIGTSGGTTGTSITTLTTSGTVYRHVKVKVNGVSVWLALLNNPS